MAAELFKAPFIVTARMIRHRRLAYELTKRELLDRYSGQFLGAAWAIIQPLAMVSIFILIFGIVFKMRVKTTEGIDGDFVTYLVSGLIPWMVMQEVLARGPSLIQSQSHLVKQVVFPLEVLAVRITFPAFLTLFVGLGIVLVRQVIDQGSISPLWICVPFLAVLLAMSCMGFALLLGALGVFVRDIKDVVQFILFAAIYISPIFYSIDAAPPALQVAMYLNPFSSMILCFQDAIFYGTFAHPWAWAANFLTAVIVYTVGARIFTATRHYFGNYL